MERRIEIELRDLHFFARHGLFPQERSVGNEFAVSLEVSLAASADRDFTSMDQSVSYADLYEEVKEAMAEPEDLLERVGGKIADRLLGRFPLIERGVVSISKLAPPIPGICGTAVVRTFFEKSGE